MSRKIALFRLMVSRPQHSPGREWNPELGGKETSTPTHGWVCFDQVFQQVIAGFALGWFLEMNGEDISPCTGAGYGNGT